MIPPKQYTDKLLYDYNLYLDRSLWRVFDKIQEASGKIFMSAVFNDPYLAQLAQQAQETAKREKEKIEYARKHKKDTPVFQWTV